MSSLSSFAENAILITLCLIAYILLFAVAVYTQSHTFACQTGPTGPQGFVGPIGDTGPSADTATAYMHDNALITTIAAPFPKPQLQSLPAGGIPWKTLEADGDNALFAWSFQIDTPSADPVKQATITLRLKGAATVRPFRTIDSKQVIVLNWVRPADVTIAMPNIQVRITRNSESSVIVTAVQGLAWTMSGGAAPDNAANNVFCTDMDFIAEDIFMDAQLNIPSGSTETVVTVANSVQVIKK